MHEQERIGFWEAKEKYRRVSTAVEYSRSSLEFEGVSKVLLQWNRTNSPETERTKRKARKHSHPKLLETLA